MTFETIPWSLPVSRLLRSRCGGPCGWSDRRWLPSTPAAWSCPRGWGGGKTWRNWTSKRPRSGAKEASSPGIKKRNSVKPGHWHNFLFQFPFGKQNHWLAWRANQWPPSGKYFSLLFFWATPSSPSRTLDLPHALLPELQRNKETTCCVTLGVKIPGQHSQLQLTQT